MDSATQDAVLESSMDSSTVRWLSQTQASLSLPSSSLLGRRTSAISLSSLHRPPYPHKLDLSAASLRIAPDETSIFTGGLASPVTLAPKSARPSAASDFPPEFMTAFSGADNSGQPVGLDITIPELAPSAGGVGAAVSQIDLTLDPSIGSSADKPIELDLDVIDLDMTDLFGDTVNQAANVEDLFTPSGSVPASDIAVGVKAENQDRALGMDMLQAFSGDDDLLASLNAHSNINAQSGEQGHPTAQFLSAQSDSNNPISPSAMVTNSSPGSILASLTADSHLNASNPLAALPSADAPFDLTTLDFSQLGDGFFTGAQNTDMHMMDIESLI
jgi:hypothetical protein